MLRTQVTTWCTLVFQIVKAVSLIKASGISPNYGDTSHSMALNGHLIRGHLLRYSISPIIYFTLKKWVARSKSALAIFRPETNLV